MKKISVVHTHAHAGDCGCGHSHDHASDGQLLPLRRRWILAPLLVVFLLFLLRPFMVEQMLVRVTSYAAASAYDDVVRMCHKIIAIDPDNIQAWTSLGYAYHDLSQTER